MQSGGGDIIKVADAGAWLGNHIMLERIVTEIGLDCSKFTTSGGIVSRGDSSFAVERPASRGDGGWTLPLALDPAFVNSQYRAVPSNNPSSIHGTVTAEFDGGLSSGTPGELLFDFQVTYQDSTTTLSHEGGSMVLRRASSCQ